MPRGSKPGERRGGRQRTTPNKRTVLADRILAAASEHPAASWRRFVIILVKDRELPPEIRVAVAQKSLPGNQPRSAEARAERSSARKRQPTMSASPVSRQPQPATGPTQPYPTGALHSLAAAHRFGGVRSSLGTSSEAEVATADCGLPAILDVLFNVV